MPKSSALETCLWVLNIDVARKPSDNQTWGGPLNFSSSLYVCMYRVQVSTSIRRTGPFQLCMTTTSIKFQVVYNKLDRVV